MEGFKTDLFSTKFASFIRRTQETGMLEVTSTEKFTEIISTNCDRNSSINFSRICALSFPF